MFSVFLALPVALVFAAEDPLPKAETVLDRYIEATGGKAAYEKVRSSVASGTIEVPAQNLSGPITIYRSEGRSYTVSELPGVGRIEEGVSGDVAWQKTESQGARLKQGEEKANSVRGARLDAEANWRKYYRHVETAGIEAVHGKPCYRVVVTPAEGAPQTRYYDRATGLLARAALIVKSPMGEIQAENDFNDYRASGGILSPRRITQRVMGRELVIRIDKLEYNPDVPKGRFDPPAEVQALLAKEKAP
jgi:hypothetical protein